MSDTDTSYNCSDEDLILLQKVVAEDTARELGQEPNKSRESSTTSESSTSSSDSETSSSSFEGISDLELALALKKLHDKDLKRLKQMIVSLRECRKKLIEYLVEKRKTEILNAKAACKPTE